MEPGHGQTAVGGLDGSVQEKKDCLVVTVLVASSSSSLLRRARLCPVCAMEDSVIDPSTKQVEIQVDSVSYQLYSATRQISWQPFTGSFTGKVVT